jgi:hemolysin III
MPAAVPAHALHARDERVSMLIHALGIALSAVGLTLLVFTALRLDSTRALLGGVAFGLTLLLLYTASTLYHAASAASVRGLLRRFDHIAIYLLIAGTYTPFTLLALRGAWGWGLLLAIWLLAAVGSAMEFGAWGQRRWIAALVYVGMGWIGLLAFAPLHTALAGAGLALLLLGGAAYTLGVPFYLWRRLRYHHSVWHLFVLTGSVLHFLAVLMYVLPLARAPLA